MTLPITPADIKSFADSGALHVRRLLSSHWMDQLRGVFDELKSSAYDLSSYYDDGAAKEAMPARPAPKSSLVKDDNWMTNDVMRRFLFESPIAAAAAQVLESGKVQIYEDLLIFKAAGAAPPTPWHQDEPQWPLKGRQMCSVWLCLESVKRDTGALRFVAGSHRGPLYVPYVPSTHRAKLAEDMHYFTGGPLPDVDADPERFPVVSFDTEPGDVVIFHPRALHAAFGGEPKRARRTFSIRFLGDDVRWLTKKSVFHPWLSQITLVEGDAVSGERFPQVWPA
jgi:ectoine hydroxylase-related dioxygenase (phytanoyl-CoA dioxygenase family)